MALAKDHKVEYDYIVVGGGTAGCAVVARLSEALPEASIAVVEAGPDITNHPFTQEPLSVFQAHFSEVDYQYYTELQPQLGDRRMYNAGGKGLGGGSAINYGGWTRGCKLNYDLWAEIVGDEKWNYEHMLPYFMRTENYVGETQSGRGSSGPLQVSTVSASSPERRYPLRDPLKAAYEHLGLQSVKPESVEDTIGVGETIESWRNGKRQFSATAYKLSSLHIDILTSTPVQKIIIDPTTKRATGIQLSSGQQLHAHKEIILSAGSYRTPQLLMLSGIGPDSELTKHNIPIIHSNPAVGQNLHDHPGLYVPFKLREPTNGLAVGSPKFMSNPAFLQGLPYDWLVTGHSTTGASTLDPSDTLQTTYLQNPKYAHHESFIIYAPAGQPITNKHLPPIPDGSHIGAIVVGFAVTSRGTVTLSSANATDHPVIDPKYLSTTHDIHLMRDGLRLQLNTLLGTDALKPFVDREDTPPDCKELTINSSDEDLDERILSQMQTFYHPGGTASMGSVVDTRFRVLGVDGLRVCDASVIPVPISAHLQACVYALAERAAEMILEDGKREE